MIWTIILVAICIYVTKKILAIDAPNSLDVVPGPPRYPIVGNGIVFFGTTPEQIFNLARKFHKEFGDRFLIKVLNRRILHISHPDDVEIVLSHSKNIKKSKPYKFLEPWLGTGLLLSTGNKWRLRRKILTPAFHFNILKNFSTIIEEKCRELVSSFKLDTEVVDLMPVVSNFTLHTICETAMGTQLDVDKSKASVQYKNAIFKIGGLLLDRLTRLWLHPKFIFFLSSRGKVFKNYLETVHAFANNVILERKTRMKKEGGVAAAIEGVSGLKRLAMLDLLLAAEEKGEIDLEGIREEVNTFMFEGHDTTAMAITFGLMILAKHKDIQEKIYQECQKIFGGSDRAPTMDDFSSMVYTKAVIKEILRLYPSVPFIAREITEDFMMGDLFIKAGSEVAIHIYDIHRRADMFPDPEAFKPERFLDNDENRHPFAYIPFSAGPRNCIGQRFAMQEMICVLSEIVRVFFLESTEEHPKMLSDLVLRPTGPVRVKFVRRIK